MKLGDKGIDVIDAQHWLISIGYLDEVEPFYSINTRNAVQLLEIDLDLEPTGNFYEELKIIYELRLSGASPAPDSATGGVGGFISGPIVESSSSAMGSATTGTSQEFPCYILNLLTGAEIFIPHVPEEFSYSKGTVFEEQLTKGRSEPFQGYTGSSALTTNVSFVVTADYAPSNDIDLILNQIEALCYPLYESIVQPPKALFRCGTFSTEGIVTEVTITRKLPIIDGKYSQAEVSIAFAETRETAPSANEVGVAGWRG